MGVPVLLALWAAQLVAASASSAANSPMLDDSDVWTARMSPCGRGLQNQSWTFTSAGTLQSDIGPRCVDGTERSGCGSTCGRALLNTCSSPVIAGQRWEPPTTGSRLVTGATTGSCLLIRENPLIDPGILYHASPCKNTSNEQWHYDRGSGQLQLQCTSGTCLPWNAWCLTAAPPPPPPIPPAPVPNAPLTAIEMYRSRVHTAGHYCCPNGQSYCNATSSMRAARCSGYYDYGSPQLVLSKNGTLLSFNQGERKAHQDDNNWIDVMLTRSFDMGQTWLPVQVVHSENSWRTPTADYQSIGQNTAVLDEITGVIHLLFTRNNTEAFHTSSSDDGVSWARPTSISKPGCADCWIAPSFSAIQLKHGPHVGDLVACLDYSNLPGHQGGGPVERSGTLISSDHGSSWHVGATGVLGDECAIAELANGTVVLNARNYVHQAQKTVHRSIAWSLDGGRSFTPVYFAPSLPDPIVEGAMIFGRYTPLALGVGQPLFFTNPASESAREDITLKMSVDGAAHWSTVRLVQKGCGMYSSVVQFTDGTLGVQWDDAHGGPISHAGLANETFVRLRLAKR